MTLLQMSFAGAVMILAVLLLRGLFLNRLPKKTFFILWGMVLLRLLIPVSVPSRFSVYNLNGALAERISANESPAQMMTNKIQSDKTKRNKDTAERADRNTSALQQTQMPTEDRIWENAGRNLLAMIWAFGALFCGTAFFLLYMRSVREFDTSLPADNAFTEAWIRRHRIYRPVSIRQSDKFQVPLTYGIFRPVILLPKTTDWEKTDQLRYILAHEYVHIRRFDNGIKLFLAAAVALHWFNPLVWIMYVTANQDMELSCDEAVVRRFGVRMRASYALTLIEMEEGRIRPMPFGSFFNRNATKERIVAIMKTKQRTFAASLSAALLIGILAGTLATSAAAITKSDADRKVAANASGNAQIQALKPDHYKKMYISTYRENIQTMADEAELEKIAQDKELQTMQYADEDAEYFFHVLWPLTRKDWISQSFSGAAVTNFPDASDNGKVEYTVTLTIRNADKLTVNEYRNALLEVFHSYKNHLDITKNKYLEYHFKEMLETGLWEAQLDMLTTGLMIGLSSENLSVSVQYTYVSAVSPAVTDEKGTMPGENEAQKQQPFNQNTEENTERNTQRNTQRAEDTVEEEHLGTSFFVNGKEIYYFLYYRFFCHISDKAAVTEAERKRCLDDFKCAVFAIKFPSEKWTETDAVVSRLQDLAAQYSTDEITLCIDNESVLYQCIEDWNFT